MSGGAAVADVDGDGDLDLFVTRLDATDILFENLGNGTFTDSSLAAGLTAFDLQSNANGNLQRQYAAGRCSPHKLAIYTANHQPLSRLLSGHAHTPIHRSNARY